MTVPFSRPTIAGKELEYLQQALDQRRWSGDQIFSQKCEQLLETLLAAPKVMVVPSCTAGLEMAAMLIDVQPGDEIILPSFTFVSTANAFVLRGAKLVFVDVRPDTLNIDERLIESAITAKTKAICVVHYAGVSVEMNPVLEVAKKHGLYVIEDAAQAIDSFYFDRPLGTLGDLAAFSFHETKNISCGEGGALIINDAKWTLPAEIIREKGTNRSQFFRGEVDKYTWVGPGSSYLTSEFTSAVLLAQLESIKKICDARRDLWQKYHLALEDLESRGKLSRQVVPSHCKANGHIYWIMLEGPDIRDSVIKKLREQGIVATFHYQSLHTTKIGRAQSGICNELPVTENASDCLLRLPLYNDMPNPEAIVEQLAKAL
ncbi:MAG: dTDP-4-amino-4,6-dideoxygalactose transaminase [Bdellovibrionales bacterium CG10_big_fil_rev_8_21_14_0_10_45_34]|nr:MAG: dTDP-4-amino-4,6-dideoxygalactose transaminase [Bdellovibrionales bacterium CG10_big_fil_rev_8_21_14_0_10_45_34]